MTTTLPRTTSASLRSMTAIEARRFARHPVFLIGVLVAYLITLLLNTVWAPEHGGATTAYDLLSQPIIPAWKEIFQNAVPRPSAPTKANYNEVSSLFWSAVHNTLSGNGSAAENLEVLEADLTELKGDAW